MSTKRDLVEAHSYNRRRLITAFVSGAPGGREVEPTRYGRTLVGGAVLAVMVVVGAAVSGFIAQPVPDDWAQRGIVVGKDSGTRFFANDDTLYPVLNYTSALLLLGDQGDAKATTVPEDDIAGKPKGTTLGISGAPEALPSPGALVQSGWTACTSDGGGIRLSISPTATSTAATDAATLVSADDQEWAIVGEHRYAVPAGAQRTSVLRALQLDGATPVEVSGTWLDLIRPGEPLAVPELTGAGRQVDTGVSGLNTVGTPVRVDGQPRVLGRNGELIAVSEFAYRLYASGAIPEQKETIAQVASLRTDNDSSFYPANWPENAARSYTSPQTPCLRLSSSTDEAPVAALANPRGDSAAPVAEGTVERRVANGKGALVRSTTAGVVDVGTVYLVDGTGTAYAVGTRGQEKQTLTSLRLGKADPVAVPRSWIDVLGSGPRLSAQAAARPATTTVTNASSTSGGGS